MSRLSTKSKDSKRNLFDSLTEAADSKSAASNANKDFDFSAFALGAGAGLGFNPSPAGSRTTNNRDETVDIVKEMSNFILDEDLYDIYDMHSATIPEIPYRKSGSSSPKTGGEIDLKSLKPPSPSILPFDQQFLSDIWRPPTPSNSSFAFAFSAINEGSTSGDSSMPIKFSENIGRSDIQKPTPVRLEDLEEELSKPDFFDKKAFAIASEVATQEEFTFKNLDDDQKPPVQKEDSPRGSASESPRLVAPPPGFETPGNLAFPPLAGLPGLPPGMATLPPELIAQQMNILQNPLALLQFQKSLFELAQGRPLPVDPMAFMAGPNGKFPCTPFFNQQQQDIISKIIVPAQAQQKANLHKGPEADNQRKYENFMTQRDRDFLYRVFQLQTKRNDPYIDDYYEMSVNGKKLQDRNRRKLAQEMSLPADDPAIDAIIESQPMFVLPDRAERDIEKPRIIQFDGTLGKIQSANSRFPRKFFDIEEDTSAPLKLDSYQTVLQRIENAYGVLLEMIDEERRLPILPDDMKLTHREGQIKMCNELFSMLLAPSTGDEKRKSLEPNHFTLIGRNMPTLPKLQTMIDPQIDCKSKGVNLMIRFLKYVEDERQLTVLLCSLLKWAKYESYVLGDENIIGEAGIFICKALQRVFGSRNLIYIAASLDDWRFFTENMFGHKMLVTLFNQYEGSDEKASFLYFWKMFVNAVDEHVRPISNEMHELCVKHLQYLAAI